MDHFHISDHVKKIVQNYIGEIQLRFTVDNKTTAWQKLEKRKVTGCTISTIHTHYEYGYHHYGS